MSQQSREKQAMNNMQRTGLSVLSQPQMIPVTSSVRSLGFDTMSYNQPVYFKTEQSKQQPYNYSQFYQTQPEARYQSQPDVDDAFNQQMQPYIMNRNDEIRQPQYQSAELQRKPTDPRQYDNNRGFVGQRNQMYDQLSSLAQKHVVAQKTAEQIVNEFKAYTLPKLRLKRFIKMQALMKGYHVRRFVIPRLRQRLRLYQIIIDDFIRNTISDKFVPDIVMEVIAYNKHNQDLSLYSDKHRVYIKYMDDILFRVVKKLAREVVKEQTDYLVTSIMNKRHQEKPQAEKDPLKLLTLVCIGRFIEKEVFVIAKECIRDMSLDYFKDLQYTQILKEVLVPNTVRFVVFEALDEIIMERYIDQILNNLTMELSNPLASHMYELIVAEQESYSLDKALQNYMYRMIGDVLLEHILLQLQDEQNFDKVLVPKLFDGYQNQQKKQLKSIQKDSQQNSIIASNQISDQRDYQKKSAQKSQDKSLISIQPQDKSFISSQQEIKQKSQPNVKTETQLEKKQQNKTFTGNFQESPQNKQPTGQNQASPQDRSFNSNQMKSQQSSQPVMQIQPHGKSQDRSFVSNQKEPQQKSQQSGRNSPPIKSQDRSFTSNHQNQLQKSQEKVKQNDPNAPPKDKSVSSIQPPQRSKRGQE